MIKNNVNILWVESRSYLPEDTIQKHSHSFFHYIFVAGGNGEIKINETSSKLKSNNIYLIKPNEEHSFCAGKTEKLVTLEVKFEVLDSDLSAMLYSLPSHINVAGMPVYESFSRIYSECITKKPFYKELSGCQLKELIFLLKRSLEKENTVNETDAESSDKEFDDMGKITVYIKNNIDNNISLQELADLVNLEKTYFIKKFKTVMGTTPMQYVKKARLEKAKKLLLYSDMNITQISDALNFSSIHRFSEFFINETGISPQKFKKQEKNTI